MKKCLIFLLTGLLLLANYSILPAADIEFDSFAEAEAAAKKRAEEYQKKMDEHLKQVQSDWEKQQKDLGESDASPDITKITSSSDGNKSSDSEAQKNMENAVNSSVNKMKDLMINSATPNTTGFAGGGAGYQWSVKFVNGKYILSDSYNEAAFGTGDKREDDPEPEPAEPVKDGSGEDEDEDMVVADKPDSAPSSTTGPSTSSTPPTDASDNSSTSTSPAAPATPDKPADKTPASTGPAAGSPATPAAKPAPGIDPAPTKLPEPDVRMVIQHPTDFSEEIFSTNADNGTTTEYTLNKFKIPEDTRVKIALELSKDIDPSRVSLVVTDEEGKSPPVDSGKTKNYRHMFRVPSDDKYSAAVVIKDGADTKEIMKVQIPVVKVDFDSRTIDDQRRKIGSEGLTSSAGTTHSSSESDYNHSSFGKSQQVDLSDLYSDPDANSDSRANSPGNTGNSSSGNSYGNDDANYSGNSENSSGSNGSGSGNSANSSDSANSGNSSTADGNSGNNSSSSSANSSSDSNIDDQGQVSENSDSNANGSTDENGNLHQTSADNESETDDESGYAGTNHNSNSNANGSSDSAGYSSGSGQNSGSGSGSNSDSDYTSASGTNDENLSDSSDSDYNQGAGQGSGSGYGDNAASGAKVEGSSAMAGAQKGMKDGEDEQDPFVMALSMQAVSRKIYQSFDFIDEKNPVSAEIPAGTEITFSMSFANTVDHDSVSIELNDGQEKVTGDLKTWGEAFAYVFKKPAKAYFIVRGRSQKNPFSYKLNIPVK